MDVNIRRDGALSVVELTGSINSGNAHEFEAALSGEPSGAEGMVIDAGGLAYISSAGLRVLLAAKKRCKGKIFRIFNVTDEVMSVFDVTGFSEIMDITRAVRQLSVEGCERIGAGACGEVFRLDDETIIKLYYPRVKMYAAVCHQIHGIEAEPGQLPSFKDINRADIPNVTGITAEECAYLHRFLDLVPDRMNCLHGDLNSNNIMVQGGECCLIDMGEFSTGTPMLDLSRILFSMELAGAAKGAFNSFYQMPQDTVDRILHLFLEKYFGCPLAEAEKTYPDAVWLYPLAWFRCCTSLLKGDRWGEEKRAMALDILRTKLIPFIDARYGK